MKRAWIAIAATALVGLLAGLGLAGLPGDVDQTEIPATTVNELTTTTG